MTASNCNNYNKNRKPSQVQPSLAALTAAALALPGLLAAPPTLAEDDEVDFSYSHYQEGLRTSSGMYLPNANTGEFKRYTLPRSAPIEADTIRGNARVSLSDRIKFGFNYNEDTWSGATPLGSAPEGSHAYTSTHLPAPDANGDYVLTSASAWGEDTGAVLVDAQRNLKVRSDYDALNDRSLYTTAHPVHVMGYASPETRKQGDFKLSYDWDNAQARAGGGVSDERDFYSRFVNLGGRLDFNQKRTSLDLALSYTGSNIDATRVFGSHPISLDPSTVVGHSNRLVHGDRQDWSAQLGLTQVVNPSAVLNLGAGFNRNTGFLSNPYKVTWFGGIDPSEDLQDGFQVAHMRGFYDHRPTERNQWSGNLGWTQYVQPLDAALHFNYQFSHDDWDVNAHTFDADWVQPLGEGWALTPRVRYYSQSAADFYTAFSLVGYDSANTRWNVPAHFSSDQRLSGFGALSGGVVLAKQFAKGVSFETGFEYYSHKGHWALGGGGEQAFADYDYWVANAALKVKLSAIGRAFDGGGAGDEHSRHAEHANVPAGLMFAHTLNKAGDIMAGYRYQHTRQAGDYLHGSRSVSQDQAALSGCPRRETSDAEGNNVLGGACPMLPTDMTQSMHMLELMYAPTDWLTLMLMPQFMDMQSTMTMPQAYLREINAVGMSMEPMLMEVGGIGDTGFYALVTLFDTANHHLHASIGGTAPTGDVAQRNKSVFGFENNYKDYSMQLGSGTWDLKPSLTYTGKAEAWNWGAQLGGTWRTEARNASAYKLGDLFETSVWGGYDWTDWLSSSLRLAYTWQGAIKGHFPQELQKVPTCNHDDFVYDDGTGNLVFDQDSYNGCLQSIVNANVTNQSLRHVSSQDEPRNYGGHYLDLGLGVAVTIPNGAFAGHRLAFEWQQPLYTNVNGYQLDRDHALTFTWSYGF